MALWAHRRVGGCAGSFWPTFKCRTGCSPHGRETRKSAVLWRGQIRLISARAGKSHGRHVFTPIIADDLRLGGETGRSSRRPPDRYRRSPRGREKSRCGGPRQLSDWCISARAGNLQRTGYKNGPSPPRRGKRSVVHPLVGGGGSISARAGKPDTFRVVANDGRSISARAGGPCLPGSSHAFRRGHLRLGGEMSGTLSNIVRQLGFTSAWAGNRIPDVEVLRPWRSISAPAGKSRGTW